MPVPIALSQRDPAWKDILLGNDDTSTIGRFGCLLTDLVIVSNLYGFQETPASLNTKMKAAGGFLGPLIVPRLLPSALPGMRHLNFIQCRDVPAPLAEIDSAMAAGRTVIVELDFSPARGLQNHWVVIYAAAEGGDYLIRDPYPWTVDQQEIRLTSRYGFGGKPAQVIQSVLWLDGPGQPVAPVPIEAEVTASFPAYASADALALRTAPVVADETLIERLPLNTRLDLLAADDAAKAAIGGLNQWLPARAPDGKCGYVAAWYLSLQPAAPEAVPFMPQPAAGESLVVHPSADQVALRTKPRIGPYTLIRRLNRDEELRVLEPADAAQAKVGQDGAWLNVADIHNQAGYIAAWLVAPSGSAALGAVKKRPPSFGPQGLVVRAAADNLALRSAEQISDNTLIKRLRVGANLQVLEDPDLARQKIGRVGQWLLVRDITGAEGCVAAWYVSL